MEQERSDQLWSRQVLQSYKYGLLPGPEALWIEVKL